MHRVLLFVILLCNLASPVMAQQQTEPAAETEVNESVPDSKAVPEIDIAAEPVTPGKYEASEQISDDLSVSFPVDI
jgi:hypothetical protein